MDWAKLDAALAAALTDDDGTGRFLVLIHATGPPAPGAAGAPSVRTDSLSAQEIEQLTDQPEVRQVRLSSRLGLAGGG